MKKILEIFEPIFTVFALVFYSGGPLSVILSGGISEGDEGSGETVDYALIRLVFLFIYLVTAILLLARWKKVLYVLSKDRFIWIFVAFALLSVLWSFSADLTFRRGIGLIGTTMFGLYLATRYNMKQQLQMLGLTFGVAIALSIVFAVVLKKYGLMHGVHEGKWRGIYTHKNVLGQIMAESSIVFVLLAIEDAKNRFKLGLGFAFSVILLLLSKATTALINFVILLTALPVYRTFRWRYELMIPAFCAIATVGAIVYEVFTANASTLLGFLGKDTSLTGRTNLWPAVLDMIWKHPWLGYGYSAFWLGWEGESAYVWRVTMWDPPSSHNGFLDLWLELGLVGVAIFAAGFWASLSRALIWVRVTRTAYGFWPLLFLTYLVQANLAETALMEQNNIFWVLYTAVAFSVNLPPEGETTKSVDLNAQPDSYHIPQ